MEKRKPKQVDPIGENVQLDHAVMASTVPPTWLSRSVLLMWAR
jgi:hypothetical protein